MSKKMLGLIGLGILLLAILVASGKLFEHNPSNTILVVQSPVAGTLTVHTSPGMKWQGFGTVTFYEKRVQYSFSATARRDKRDESLPVQFADGGKAKISGVISWEMPMTQKEVIQLHYLYGSQYAIEQQLVRPTIERSLYLTGTLMTSAEAYAARKAEFLSAFEDQVKDGIYQMETISEKRPDPITGTEKTVQTVRIVRDKNNPIVALRSSESPLKQFSISILPPAIDDIDFDKTVKDQIAEQQKAIMQVMTAQAKAREAEQRFLTVTKEGEADAAKARWAQEVFKAQKVTESEMNVLVAQNGVKAAELNKRAKILDGEGEAEARKLVMNADGALAVKIEAYKHVQDRWAQAFENFKGQLVPTVVTGGAAAGGNAAVNFMELMGIKAAKDLAVDVTTKR
ncbi:MAG TPA: SPFH domain-containing protein [Candidatus Polarisedimenticolia bacterium]|nr:SPFH domain-containing protein [Candidatus Polarisedimenticolia bacterium]